VENNGCALTMKEAKFDTDELFFSITDDASAILSSNEVFVRVSGYSKEELIGRYHNIIRHEDMPKVVFKALWDHLKNGQPIVAYVKNKTKEGGYYWVMAAAFPLGERYISIRIKPHSPIFDAVRELYFKLLMAENQGGMEMSSPLLLRLLGDLGYSGYDHFMSDALLTELYARKKILGSDEGERHRLSRGESASSLYTLLDHSRGLMRRYERWFDNIDFFKEVKTVFEEKGVMLRHLARDIVFLSLNASVASYKVAQGGETFGVLASDVRINAKENDLLIGRIHALSQSLSETLNALIFTVSSLRLQIDMVSYFIRENLARDGEAHWNEVRGDLASLVELVALTSHQLHTQQTTMESIISDSLKYLDQLEQQVMYLGYIQVYGIIEAASNRDETIDFSGIFSQLKELIRTTSEEVETLQKIGAAFMSENAYLIEESNRIEAIIAEFRRDTEAIKFLEV
jgi:PAS domain S-box-containing protein